MRRPPLSRSVRDCLLNLFRLGALALQNLVYAKVQNIFQTTKYCVYLSCHNTNNAMIGYIYKTTNKLNNWIYIGQHRSSKFSKSYKGSGKVLIEAFELYGKENFHTEVICWAETMQQLNDLENLWISAYRIENCYNISGGGNGGLSYIYVDIETKLIYLSAISASLAVGVNQSTFLRWVNRNGRSKGYDKHVRYSSNSKISNSKGLSIYKRWVMLPANFLLRMQNPKFA